MLDKFVYMNLLYDFYGQFLTERQSEIVEMYYYLNYSLGEIAEKLGISRQGVYDILKRAEELMLDYEGKLGLVKNYEIKIEKLDSAIKILEEVICKLSDADVTARISEVKNILLFLKDN